MINSSNVIMQTQGNMIQSQQTSKGIKDTSSNQGQWKSNRYMGQNSWRITKWLNFQYFILLQRYFLGVDDQNILITCPSYQPMYSNQYLWARLCKKRSTFNLFKEIFLAQRAALLIIIFISSFIGGLALVGAYFQRFLFLHLQDEELIAHGQHVDHPFETSGWVYFGIIIGTTILRFFAFNYVQGLANQVSRNIRIHLQNCYFRVLIRMDTKQEQINEGFLINNFYVSINIVSEVLKLLPYIILSVVIVLGISAFIIGIVGAIGTIVYGFVAFVLMINFGIAKYMLHLHHRYVAQSDKRTMFTRLNGTFMLRLTYNKLITPLLNKLKQWRGKETKIDFKYNLADGMMQVITTFVPLLTIFILYVVEQKHDDQKITLRQIFNITVLFTVFKTPFKMIGYGTASLLEAYAAIHRLQDMFNKCFFNVDDLNFKRLEFPRLYNQNPCLQTTMEVNQEIIISQIRMKDALVLPVEQGIMTMVLGKLDSEPSCEKFMDEIEDKIRSKEKTIAKIDYKSFLISGSIRQNILFYHDFDQQSYRQVLQVTRMQQFIEAFAEGDALNIEHNSIETLFEGLSLKIQLARALYTNCQFLLINRLIFKQYEEVMENIRKYRNSRNQTTIVVNLSGSFYHLADQMVVLSKGRSSKGSYQKMKMNPILKQFEAQFLKNSDTKLETRTKIQPIMDIKVQNKKKIQVYPHYFLRFYGLVHWCVAPIVILLLLIPALLDLYFQIIVAEAFQSEQHFFEEHGEGSQFDFNHEAGYSIVLRSGITFMAFVIMESLKVTLLALFIRFAAYRIFAKMMKKFFQTSLESSLSTSLTNRSLDLQKNLEHIDTKFTSDMDMGITILFEQITAVLFGSISSALFLFIGIPFLILIFIGLYLMARINKMLFIARISHISNLNSFFFKLLDNKKDFAGFKVDDALFKQFSQFLRKQVIFESNTQWLLEALGITLEIVFMLMLAVSMIISLVRFDVLSGDAFIELSISFLIGLTNTSRIELKMMEIMNNNIIGISNIFILLDQPSPKTAQFKDDRIDLIEFDHFGTTFQQNKAKNITFKIERGERIVVVGSKRSGKRTTFLNLIKILQQSDVEGSILFNGKDIYKNMYSRRSLGNYIYFLENNPMILDPKVSVGEQLSSQSSNTIEEIQQKLNEIWTCMEMKGSFDVNSNLEELTVAQKQIYNLLRGYILQPSVFVLDGGMSHIQNINREKLTLWIISKKQFGIVIDLTNQVEVIRLYNRIMTFKDGFLHSDQMKTIGASYSSLKAAYIPRQQIQKFKHP